MAAIDELLEVMKKLRSPEGCPWDREQTHQSLKMMLIEECYEVLEAIEFGKKGDLVEELGDVLLHVVFHCEMARERGEFDFHDVAKGIKDKLIRRHPHVFGDEKVRDSGEVLSKWQEIKSKEKPERKDVFDGIPAGLPALMFAQELQKKASKKGLDWKEPRDVLEKVREEVQEVEEAFDKPYKMKEEIGDMLFTLVNLARKLGLDAEDACRAANQKFMERFKMVNEKCVQNGVFMEDLSEEMLDKLWREVKLSEKA